jgi:hypothetical protein
MHFLLDIMLTVWLLFLCVVKSVGYVYDRTMGTQQITFIKFDLQKMVLRRLVWVIFSNRLRRSGDQSPNPWDLSLSYQNKVE